MKRITLLIKSLVIALWTAFTFQLNGQAYEPSILILSPDKITADKGLKQEIAESNNLLQGNYKQKEKALLRALKEMSDAPENVKLMLQKQVTFSKDMDFYASIPSVAEGYLQYRFFERFENLFIYASKETSNGDIGQLTNIADKHEMQYVVNFPVVNSFLENGAKRTTIRVQLYDNHQKAIVLDETFTGSDENPGFEFACDNGSLACTINNVLSQALGEIINVIANNNPTIIREQELAIERADVLFSTIYSNEPAREVVRIIETNDTSIPTAGFYQGFMNDDQTKFIGFFALDSGASNFKELTKKSDKNVKIISSDLSNLNNVPSIYANVVIGVKHNSKWYLKKDNATYFNSDNLETGKKDFFNNLQQWDFFKGNSSEYNSEFWEANFFQKVEDVTKAPDYEEYYESIYKSKERRNKGFVGMYKVVADQMRKEQAELIGNFKGIISEQVFRPFLEQQKIDKPNEFADYSITNKKFTLIFPKDKSVVINPVRIKDEKGNYLIRYFVVFPNAKEVYEWTYLKPKKSSGKSSYYGIEVIDQLSVVTDWNYGFETLDDQKFWADHVLTKNGDEFKYLVRVN